MAEEKKWETREGTFSLRRNPNKKDDQSKTPDMIGHVCIQGVVYELSAWTKIATSGAKWLSGTIKPPYATQGAAPPRQTTHDDSDIPF